MTVDPDPGEVMDFGFSLCYFVTSGWLLLFFICK